MTMTTGAATTLLGNLAGARPLGHDGAVADALIAVPVGLFQSLMAQSSMAQSAMVQPPWAQSPYAQQAGWYGSPGMSQGSPFGGAFNSPYGAARPHDLVAVPAHLFQSLIGPGGHGYSNGYGTAPAAGLGIGQVQPFQVIPGGFGYR